MKPKIIGGKTEDAYRRKSGIVCNGYVLDGFAVDAPEGAEPPDELEMLILTHPHCDHFISASKYGCPVAASEYAAELIENKRDDICLCSFVNLDFPEIKISKKLEEGDILKSGGTELRIIETPGHVEGALCIYEPNKKYLFSGDTVFPGYAFPNTSLPEGSPGKLKQSYKKLAELEIEIIYPGHGEPVKEKNYIEKLLDILDNSY